MNIPLNDKQNVKSKTINKIQHVENKKPNQKNKTKIQRKENSKESKKQKIQS